MGRREYDMYLEYRARVATHIAALRLLFDELNRRAKERVWLRHQQHGDLDDSKLIDGLTGDKMIFKRRGVPPNQSSAHSVQDANSPDKIKKRFEVLCVWMYAWSRLLWGRCFTCLGANCLSAESNSWWTCRAPCTASTARTSAWSACWRPRSW